MSMPATFTSFYFFCFFAAVLLLYYVFPLKQRYIVLLLAGIVYYLLTGNGLRVLFPLAACLLSYGTALLLNKCGDTPKRKMVFWTGILLILLPLVSSIAGSLLSGVLQPVKFLIHPLGISFYTLTLLSYVIDVYNGIIVPEKNPFKIITYGIYFPDILSGPILRYREEGAQFFTEHRLEYKNITFGLQRMLWGLFKILVISERCAVMADTVYDDMYSYGGIYVVIGTFIYAFQLYTNFSGSMDMVTGMSECFGIRLPENFETPFLAKTVAEYWRRWHITLGVWMKEYVFYPIQRLSIFTKLSKKNREIFGKKTGKMLSGFIAMFFLWLTVGLWHGGDIKYIIGSGLLHWLYIVLEEALEAPFKKIYKKFDINPDNRILNILRVIRTFVLVNIGFVFFRAGSAKDAVYMLKAVFRGGAFNIFELGLNYIELTILIISLVIMSVVEIMAGKKDMRERLLKKNIIIRWAVLYALLFYTILLGYYGPGYSAADFIYQGF